MTAVDFLVLRLRVALLLEQLQRGPKFTRLPPARYWHGHVNQITPDLRVGSRGHQDYNGDTRFAVSRRKWMLDPQIDSAAPPMPAPLRMPTKAYVYCDMNAPLRRTEDALKIIESIEKAGGDVCGLLRARWVRTPECDVTCACLVLAKISEVEGVSAGHRHPGTPHRCEHGTWRSNQKKGKT